MSSGEKDKFGDKLHDVEAARENEWAHQNDERLLAKLRDKRGKTVVCPECGTALAPDPAAAIGGMACPERHGAWLDWATVVKIMDDLAHK
jgi:hypothetical protein